MGENLLDAISAGGTVRLTDWALLRAHGADAGSFLQGQLTQDVAGLSPGEARLAGYCSAKGRLLASFVVWRMAADDFGLLCSADLADAVRKRLSMYVLRARCRVDLASDWVVLGGVGATASEDLAPWRVRQQDARWLIGLPTVEGLARWLLVEPSAAHGLQQHPLDADAWRWLEVSSGVPRITAATSEQFVPQMINFELVGGVHFQKGCYPGQEVVARSQYRGTIKRRMHLFATTGLVRPGEELFHSDDPAQAAGMVVNAAEFAGSARVLAEVKLAALEHGSLRVGSAEGPVLRLLPMPYPVADAAHA